MKESHILVAQKGKQVVRVDLRKEKISNDIMKKFILGPTGNLRAPIIRKGKTLLIGFDEESYHDLLKI